MKCKYSFCVFFIIFLNSYAHSTQRPGNDDDSNPFLDMASSFLQEALANQNGAGGGGGGGAAAGIGGIASLIGNMIQPDGASGKGSGGIGAAQIFAGISSFMANANGGGGGGGGFDPSIIGNVIEMFSGGDSNADQTNRQKRSTNGGQEGIGLDTIINIASAFVNTNKVQNKNGAQDEGIMSLLPMVMDVVNSFAGPEGDKTHAKHKDHAWVLPPFLEKIHVMWDHFSSSELADALWKKSGVHSIFKVSTYMSFYMKPISLKNSKH